MKIVAEVFTMVLEGTFEEMAKAIGWCAESVEEYSVEFKSPVKVFTPHIDVECIFTFQYSKDMAGFKFAWGI